MERAHRRAGDHRRLVLLLLALPLQHAHRQGHRTLLTYARALEVWGRAGTVAMGLPSA
jgi:hypothetical protein